MAPSLWRRPGTKTFQLVHRSQRDPLIHDPEASDRVLKQVGEKKRAAGGPSTSTYQAYETSLESNEQGEPDSTVAARPGDLTDSPFADASSYGIFFDDKEYDYLQHLRTVGQGGKTLGGDESFLVEAPTKHQGKNHHKGKGKDVALVGFQERDMTTQPGGGGGGARFEMPEEALPSHPLDEVSYSNLLASKEQPGGLRLDLDPSVREVLEALDDDEYAVSDGEGTDGEDEFWGGVLNGGEGEGWHGGPDEGGEEGRDDGEEDDSVEKRVERLKLGNGDEIDAYEGEGEWGAVKRFNAERKRQAAVGSGDEDEDDFDSEMGDTIAELVKSSLNRPKRGTRGPGSALGSSFSMSSSAMHRNEGLRTLDDRFDQ
ncbi:hypothetical protein JCM10212_005683, partial [Sporobolomyces blumeae]